MNNSKSNIKIVHKWRLENYSNLFIEGYNGASFVQSEFFPSALQNKKLHFSLRLYPKGIDQNLNNEYISVYLHLENGPNMIVQCQFTLTGFKEKRYTKTIKGELSKYAELGLDEYIPSKSEILLKNEILNGLTILNELSPSTDNLELQEIFSDSDSDASLTVLKHKYEWTIPQYDFKIYKQSNCTVSSHNFSLKDKEDIKFFLRLWPNGKDNKTDKEKKHLALFLYLSDCLTDDYVNALTRFSVRELRNLKAHHSKWLYGTLVGSNGLGCDRFVSIEQLFNKQINRFFKKSELNIDCEIEVFHEEDDKNENIEEINKNYLNKENKLKNLRSSNRPPDYNTEQTTPVNIEHSQNVIVNVNSISTSKDTKMMNK